MLFALQALEGRAAAFDRLRQAHLVLGGEQRHATDLAQVQRQGFARGIRGRGFEGRRLAETEPRIRSRV